MSVRAVTVEFQKWDNYLIPNDISGGESFREHLTIQWEGGDTFLVFDDVHGNVHEVTVFTQNGITNELEAVQAMTEWAQAHEYKKEN